MYLHKSLTKIILRIHYSNYNLRKISQKTKNKLTEIVNFFTVINNDN
jgi:hypothetical protein